VHFEKSNADIMESMAEQQHNLLEMMKQEGSDIIEEENSSQNQFESLSSSFSSSESGTSSTSSINTIQVNTNKRASSFKVSF
jgi:hypothetical protein